MASVNGSLTCAIGSRKKSALQHSSGLRFNVASSLNSRKRWSGGHGAGGQKLSEIREPNPDIELATQIGNNTQSSSRIRLSS
jgi:hypothetical protein